MSIRFFFNRDTRYELNAHVRLARLFTAAESRVGQFVRPVLFDYVGLSIWPLGAVSWRALFFLSLLAGMLVSIPEGS